jgi:hypothetical protein
MADRARTKQIQLLYSFDRLAAQKLSQVYRLLVPERIHSQKRGEAWLSGDQEHEDSGDLRARFLGPAKRRANHR